MGRPPDAPPAALYKLMGVFGGLSMLGAACILATFAFVPAVRRHPYSLIFFLAVSDFFFAAKFVLAAAYPSAGLGKEDGMCAVQASLSQFFGLASISWVGAISFTLIRLLCNPFAHTESSAIYYHMVVWPYAALATVGLLLVKAQGPSGDGTCWFEKIDVAGQTQWYEMTFFAPLAAVIALALVAVGLSQRRLNLELGQPDQPDWNAAARASASLRFRLRMFAALFLLSWLGPVVHKTYLYFHGAGDAPALQYWDGVSESVYGLLNALVWLTNPVLFASFSARFLARLPGLRGRPESLPVLHTDDDVIAVGDVLRRRVLTLLVQGVRVAVADIRPDLVAALARNPRDYGPAGVALRTRSYAARNHLGAAEEWREAAEGECRFRDYCGPLFSRLRALAGVSDAAYVRIMREEHFVNSESLASFSQGRSGSFFCYSPCQSVLLKTIDRSEARVLKRLTPDLLAYLSEQPASLLARFLGFHALRLQEGVRIYVIVMHNVLHSPFPLAERFDLKGSWVERRTPGRAPGAVGKDLDLARHHRLRLAPAAAAQLWAQLSADVAFLASQRIMDYSLLVGFASLAPPPEPLPAREPLLAPGAGLRSADEEEAYHVGIIDYLQQYDWHKKAERLWKVYAKCADPAGISVQPVAVYAQRFTYRVPLLLSP